jgi:hypothetical protein
MILSAARPDPAPMRIAFLGPAGTYGEQAARPAGCPRGRLASLDAPGGHPGQWCRALADGHCDAAVVPVENSVEGGVTACLDALWEHPELRGGPRPGAADPPCPCWAAVRSEGISEVLSHPQALAQCSQWLAEHLPSALQLPTSSTAEAARMVAGQPLPGGHRFPCRRPGTRARRCWPIRSTMCRAIAPFPAAAPPASAAYDGPLGQPGLLAACQPARGLAAGPRSASRPGPST